MLQRKLCQPRRGFWLFTLALSLALMLQLLRPEIAPAQSQVIIDPQSVRPLPGRLDRTPVFNSNSPELVLSEGILLSTFPSGGMAVPSAHLDYAFRGRFDIFAHHIARAPSPTDLRTLYLGVILNNPNRQPVTVDILQAASYLSQPDAPFNLLPPQQENPDGSVFAGPGSRVTNDILRGLRQADWPAQLILPAGESQMLVNLPIPVSTLNPPLNGRSTLLRLRASGPVYVASLAQFARSDGDSGNERPPTLQEWQTLLQTGDVAGPRDRAPTPLDSPAGKLIYGRVAGVSRGSSWQAQVTDRNGRSDRLTIPQPGQAFSYGISTLVGGTLGTGQVQSAPMLVRYPDTAYQSHGNYTLEYNLSLPLTNPDPQPHSVTLTLQTPIKFDQGNPASPELRFLNPPASQVFFRGTVRLRYRDDQGTPVTRYLHLVQQRGQQGEPLVTLNLNPGEPRLVNVDLLYPPDATPPQVLTVRTLAESG